MLRRASTSKILCPCLCPPSTSRSLAYAAAASSYGPSSSENPARARRNNAQSQWRPSRYQERPNRYQRDGDRPRGPPAFPANSANRRSSFPRRDPYNLAASLEELCKAGKIEEAIEKLRIARKEAVNAAVYNILLQQVLAAKKNNLAWDLWMEMKRSGIVPTPRSYTVFFSSVVPESVTGSFLQRIKTIHSQWLDFCGKKTSQQETPEDVEQDQQPAPWQDKAEAISDIPGNAFLTLLSRLPQPDLDGMLQTFRELPSSGPTAPTRTTYTTVLFALVRQNGKLLHSTISTSGGAIAPEVDIVMSEANILSVWQRYLQDVEKRRLRMDARSISPMLRFWCQMAPRDRHNSSYRNAALDCIHQVFGLARDIKKPKPDLSDMTKEEHDRIVWLDQESFLTVLQVAAAFSQKKLAEIWFDQVRNGELPTKRGAPMPIDKRHCEVLMKLRPDTREELIIWLLRQPAIQFRPDMTTYMTALSACRFHADFALALRIIAFMSGKEDELLIKSEQRLLGTEDDAEMSKRMVKGYHTKKVTPPPSLLLELLENAKSTKDWRRLDRALKVIDFFYKPAKAASPVSNVSSTSQKAPQSELSSEEAEVLRRIREMQVEIAKSILQRGTFTSFDAQRREELLAYLSDRKSSYNQAEARTSALSTGIRRRSM